MCMYFFGIDISKQKHDCYIISATDQSVDAKFTFRNDIESFQHLVSSLNSLTNLNNIRTDFESVAYYALNLNSSLRKPTTVLWKLILASSASSKNLLL